MYIPFLTIRYLLRRRVSAVFTLLSVIFGVATFFTVLAVMEGYQVKLRELIRGLESHLTIETSPALSLRGADAIEEEILRIPGVVGVAPFVETIAMYRSWGRFSHFQLRGIDPVKESHVSDLARYLLRPSELEQIFPPEKAPAEKASAEKTSSPDPASTSEPIDRQSLEERVRKILAGERAPLAESEIEDLFSRRRRLEALRQADPARVFRESDEVPPGLVVGINLLLDRDVFLGDEVSVIILSPGSGKPIQSSFVVVGAFKSGEYEVDTRTALCRKERLNSLLDLRDSATGESIDGGLRVALTDYRQAAAVRREIKRRLAARIKSGKLAPVLELFPRVAAGLNESALAAIAEEIHRGGEGADEGATAADGPANPPENPPENQESIQRGPPPEEMLPRLRAAAATLAQPALAARVAAKLREEFDWTATSFEPSYYSDEELLWRSVQEGVRVWQDALLPPEEFQGRSLPESKTTGSQAQGHQAQGKGPAAPSEPPADRASLLDAAARSYVLRAAVRECRNRSRELFERLFPHSAPLQIRTWEDRQQILLDAVEQEKWIVGCLVFLINVFIGFLVFLMLILLVIEKTRDLGILLSLGATPRGVVSIFLYTGMTIVITGVALGLLAGWWFVRNIGAVHEAIRAATGIRLFDPETYRMDQIPAAIAPGEVLLTILPWIVLGLLASLIPAILAARRDPIKALHYE